MSRIVKPDTLQESSVCNINYGVLVPKEPGDGSRTYTEPEGFTPLFYNEHLGPQGGTGPLDEQNQESSATGLPPPENVIRLSLEELDQQISEAYRRGVEEGRQVAERGLAHVFRSLREGVDSLARLREKVMRDSEVDLLGLACLIARKIILQEIRQDPRILANIVTAAVSCCSEEEKIIIRLSPGDYQSVTQNRQLFLSGRDDESRIKIVPDDQVKHGGCMVESPTGTVDARIEAQLDEVYNRCLEERGIPMEPSISLNEAE